MQQRRNMVDQALKRKALAIGTVDHVEDLVEIAVVKEALVVIKADIAGIKEDSEVAKAME